MSVMAWSGHRPEVFRDPARARSVVERLARDHVSRDVHPTFVTGGQRGVDQWAASAGLALGVAIHLVLPIPPVAFTRGWNPSDRQCLEQLLASAASVAVIDPAERYGWLAYDLRNEALVRRAERLIVVWTGLRRGGTFYTLCAAQASGLEVDSETLEPADAFDLRDRGL